MTSERVERPRCAWLGDSREALPVAHALVGAGLGDLVVAAECGDLAGELLALVPGLRLERDWEALLTRADLAVVLVASDSDQVLEGARQLARGGARLLVCIGGSAGRLFSELTLLDAESPGRIWPLLPQRNLPAVAALARELSAGAGPEVSGESAGDATRLPVNLRAVQFERTQPGPVLDPAQLDRAFLHDADLLRSLLGRFEQLTALRHADPQGQLSQATTTLGGPDLPPVAWQVIPGAAGDWRLSVVRQGGLTASTGTTGAGTVMLESRGPQFRLWREGREVQAWDEAGAWHEAWIKTVREALAGIREGKGAPGASWDDLVRGVELLSATQESLRRRRTIDVLFEAPSERNLFKSAMTAAGCGLLLLTPVLVVLYLLVAAALPLPKWLKVTLVTLVFAPFGLFLVLQALVWITRPSAAELSSRSGSAGEQARSGAGA